MARSRQQENWSPIESALRYLGTRDHGVLVDLLQHAIDRPNSTTGVKLAPLTAPTAVLADWRSDERAHAIWQIIREGIRDPDVSPTHQSRRRRVLQAAFRLTDTDIHEPWGSSLAERFRQLKVLTSVFNHAHSTQPMEMAWKRGVALLAVYLTDRFAQLRSSADWEQYRPKAVSADSFRAGALDELQSHLDALGDTAAILRRPSRGAQPIFVNLFVTTVFMKRRAVYRRITERLITAQEDGVSYYTARGFAGKAPDFEYVPVRALWGCRAQFIEPSRPGRPAVTRLWFPEPLRVGQQAHFASEVIDENIMEERQWIDVDIDHHGIAQGALLYGGRIPVSGLTIRVRFDEGHTPEAVWWYAELNENERYDRPPVGDRRLLTVTGRDVQHTFTDRVCQPRESYGLAFSWPPDPAQ